MDAHVVNFKLVVSDLERSLAFYTGLFGFTEEVRVEFSDPDVTEVVLADASGAARLVLLHGTVMPLASVPGWAPLVVQVEEIAAARREIEESGHELVFEPLEAGPVSLLMTADPDGYLVEVVAGDLAALQGAPAGRKVPHPVPQIHDRR
ncbi:VOC family protein [Streptomyces albidoflavus]|uniref:VOC family protein n=1 Tax=Streptomyces albidoflavus TaxID=1886 RepID=UPI0033AA1EC5